MACHSSHDAINITRVPSLAAKAPSTSAWPSHFTETNVTSGLKDGYWIEAFPFRSRPDPEEGPIGPGVIAYGLGFQDDNGQPIPSDVQMHLNPYHEMKKLKTGYFTQKKILEIMALPIVVRSGDRETPAPVTIYTPIEWDKDGTPSKWETHRPLDCVFRLIHDVHIIHSTTADELDRALVAGREGVSLLWMEQRTGQWRYENIGTGVPQARVPHNNPYWGSGSVATGRVENDSVGYIASCEAFHGNLVSVHVKPRGMCPDNIVAQEHWRRFVIDDFGPLKTKDYTGTIHHVQCADLDGDGIDSIIVACMGYPENRPANMGAYVYKPVDLLRGRFTRHKVSNASAGRIAIANYRCSGTLDVATISYSVPSYHVTPNPAIRVMLNNTKQTRSVIRAEKLGDEVKILIPRADTAEHISEMPFLDIGGKVLSIVVLPPRKEYLLGEGFRYQNYDYQKDGVKVINGELSWDTKGGRVTRGIAIDAQKAASMIPTLSTRLSRPGRRARFLFVLNLRLRLRCPA
ncbi:hypothetical protein FS749_014371 [Ceratobasidium sp. UAMH 11750]|nr:hypothetical protein FS749_014371 [Ceratobasidium sp. UAMH 11750]